MLFGQSGNFAASISLASLDGSNGFRLDGVLLGDGAGTDISAAGDINGDGIGDIIIGAPGATPNGANSGASYVLFGKTGGFSATQVLDTLDGSNGFRLDGVAIGDQSGRAVSAAGDVNGDGFDDVLIGANGADPHGDSSGTTYLLFGQAGGFSAAIALSSLTGLSGWRIEGVAAGDLSGTAVSAAGDVNGDGYDDIMVGADSASPNGAASGSSYVVFGRDFTAITDQRGGTGADTLTGTSADERIIGGLGNDTIDGGGGADVLRGGGGDDTFVWRDGVQRIDGGGGNDTLRIADTGAVFLTGQSELRNLEILDLRGGSGNSVVLDAHSVRALSDAPHHLQVLGDSDDFVNLIGAWTDEGEVVAGFIRYTAGGIRVDVESDVAVLTGGTVKLNALDGADGFRLDGAELLDRSGFAVSGAGDVNGDGFDDVLIGAYNALIDGVRTGASYVVFGQASGFAATLDLNTLDGSNGFRMDGVGASARTGFAVSAAGDVNSDGFDDIIIGAPRADVPDLNTGESYVVFGKASGFTASMDLASLDGTNGVRLVGPTESYSGFDVSAAGDINGDGFGDLVIGAYSVDLNGENAGAGYLVFGKSTGFAASITLASLNGSTGFRVDGRAGDYGGLSVSGVGDINGDGFDDLAVGGLFADLNADKAGASYILFGKASGFAASINPTALNGSNGFVLAGIAVNDRSGRAVSSGGDINGDGFDDLLIGADGANLNGTDSGAAYVLFGKGSAFAATINLSALDGSNGFTLAGGAAEDAAGFALSAAGDVNGDGYDDILIGAHGEDSHGLFSGTSYLLFGQADGFAATINLDALNGVTGLRLEGFAAYDHSGRAVSAAGDVNGDGYDDLVIGAYGVDHPAENLAGSSYVIFGRDFTGSTQHQGSSADDTLSGTSADEVLIGGLGNDVMDGLSGADVLRAGAGDDTLVWHSDVRHIDGGAGEDSLRIDGSGVSLDLSAIGANHITGIERIDLTGSGNNSLSLNVRDVLALPDHASTLLAAQTHQLLIDGNSGDSVSASGQGWVQGSNQTVDGASYASYTHAGSAAQLLVDLDITRTIS